MDEQDLLKIKRNYIAAQRLLTPARYITTETFQDAFPGQFGGGPGGPPGSPVSEPAAVAPTPVSSGPEDPNGPSNPMGMSQDEFMKLEQQMTRRNQGIRLFLSGQEEEGAARMGLSYARFRELEDSVSFLKKPIPDGCVILTFDDAMLNHYEQAGPVLEKYGVNGTFFITEMTERLGGGAGFEDKTFFMTWEQIRSMYDHGHEMSSHSMHHTRGFESFPPEKVIPEIEEMDDRFLSAGMEKPVVFGYPGGQCDIEKMELLAGRGYHWARGDVHGVKPQRSGTCCYDPFIDSPLGTPSFNNAPGFNAEDIADVLGQAVDNRVAVFAYHGVSDADIRSMTFEEQVQAILDQGGHIITYQDLEEYIDPVRAYAYFKAGL